MMSPALLHFLTVAPVALVPVILLLFVLYQLDSFKIVLMSEIVEALVSGVGVAVVAYFVNEALISALNADFENYSRWVSPWVEEGLKAIFILFMIARNRIGFMIDAAIVGFAVGTGFALAENLYTLAIFHDADIGVFVVRGLGTAVMHGGSVAFFGVLAQSLTTRHSAYNPLIYMPGYLLAVALHALYNYFQSQPFIAAAAMLMAAPFTLFFIFAKSESKIHTWLISDYQSHEHLLADIESGAFARSPAAEFMRTLADRFGAETVADIFEYLKIHTQLVLSAESIALAHEKGEKARPTHEIHELFARLHALEKKIGRTAMLVLWPHLHFSRRELWELHELEVAAKHA